MGAVVHSKRKTVELEDQLFRYPTPLLSVYLFKLQQLNYSIQSVIMVAKKNETTAVAKFVTQDELFEKFKYVNSKLPILDKTSLELVVESEEQLVIAENNASEVLALTKEVDKVRKMLKEPYANTVKMIDSYCKGITDTLDRAKLRLTTQITNFKVVKEAQMKLEREQKLKELEALETEKREESEKISRIQQQLIARIYGGAYKIKDGTTKTVTGCIKSGDCVDLLKWINANVPAPTTFKHFGIMYEDMLISVKQKLAEHQNNLTELETKADFPTIREGAMRRINEARSEAIKETVEDIERVDKLITKSIKSEIRSMDSEVNEAGKGVRETLKFMISDELLVPRDMLCVDEKKVTEYLNANKEKIKADLISNQETIPGIKFYVDNKFVAR